MVSLVRRVLAASCLGLLMVVPAQAGIVYSQTADFPNNFNALTSQSQASGGNFEAYDSFNLTTVSGPTTIKSVTFQGFYWNPNGPGLNPPPLPTTQNLQVGFYENNSSNLPGTFLGATALSNFHFTKIGTSAFGPDNSGQTDQVDIYNFAGNLAAQFTFQAHTQYWMSVVSFAGPTPPLWLWMSGTGGDGLSLQYRYVTPQFQAVSRDRVFSLNTESILGGPSPIPEPGSLTLLALGTICGAGAHWRRRLNRAPVA
jgi:hypothetical protein